MAIKKVVRVNVKSGGSIITGYVQEHNIFDLNNHRDNVLRVRYMDGGGIDLHKQQVDRIEIID